MGGAGLFLLHTGVVRGPLGVKQSKAWGALTARVLLILAKPGVLCLGALYWALPSWDNFLSYVVGCEPVLT